MICQDCAELRGEEWDTAPAGTDPYAEIRCDSCRRFIYPALCEVCEDICACIPYGDPNGCRCSHRYGRGVSAREIAEGSARMLE